MKGSGEGVRWRGRRVDRGEILGKDGRRTED